MAERSDQWISEREREREWGRPQRQPALALAFQGLPSFLPSFCQSLAALAVLVRKEGGGRGPLTPGIEPSEYRRLLPSSFLLSNPIGATYRFSTAAIYDQED